MTQQAKRTLSFLVATVFFLSAVMVYATGIRGEYEEVVRLRGEQLGGEAFLGAQGEMKSKLDALIAASTGASSANIRDAVSRSLPSGEEMPNAVAQLNGVARSSGVSVVAIAANVSGASSRIAPRISVPGQSMNVLRPYETISFELKLSGPYANFKQFLRVLESNTRIFQVKAFSITPAGRPEQDFYTYSVSVAAYYQPAIP